MEKDFKKFWDEKAQKRRKSWAAKAKRFAEKHTQLEDIRKEVYLPLGFSAGFDLDDYIPLHFCERNPFVTWRKGVFGFDEDGLRKAMDAGGANPGELVIEIGHRSIRETEVPQPKINDGKGWMPNKVWDFEKRYHDWLKRVYGICTDKDTVKLTYEGASMAIKRYSREGEPFGFYELNPCEQLSKVVILMQETDFSFLNVATLLMESAAELQLRQEELNYYAKKLKIRTMEAATTESIEFELWDDKKLEKKVAEYIDKDYPVEKIIEQVLRSWKQAITKYFHAITEHELQNPTEKFDAYSLRSDFPHYVKNVLQPYFDKQGLQEVKMWRPNEKSSELFMENQGCLAKFVPWDDVFYPNAHYSMCVIYGELNNTPLRALAYYLQKMSDISKKTDEVVIKVMHLYDRLMQQKNENYRKNVEIMDSLAAQHKGTPVGKMMKFLRWNSGRFINPKDYSDFSISTIKVVGETAFSFVEKDVPQGLSMVNGQLTGTYQDEVKERWLDADCHILYAADPNTTDLDEWVITHRKGILVDRWSWSIQDFLSSYSPRDSKPSLSIDFIEQKI